MTEVLELGVVGADKGLPEGMGHDDEAGKIFGGEGSETIGDGDAG